MVQKKEQNLKPMGDDLGTNTLSFQQWPPPHHVLARFFQAPVIPDGSSGSGNVNNEERCADGLVYMRKDLVLPRAGERLRVGIKKVIGGAELLTWASANDPRPKGSDAGDDKRWTGGERINADLGGGTMVRRCCVCPRGCGGSLIPLSSNAPLISFRYNLCLLKLLHPRCPPRSPFYPPRNHG